MYLKTLEIKNFRGISHANCKFNPGLNLIIGPNDSSKTAMIDALRFSLKQVVEDHARINYSDFKDPMNEIRVNFTFCFDEDSDEKRITTQTAPFAEYLSFDAAEKPELKIWYSVKSSDEDIRYPKFKVGPVEDVATEMDAKCKDNLCVVYLRPLRDAEYELRARQGSRISKILKELKEIKSSKLELEEFLKQFDDSSTAFFDKDAKGAHGPGKPITDRVSALLNSFDEQAVQKQKLVKFGPTEKIEYQKTLERIALFYKDLLNPGLGTQNMMFIAAELLHIQTKDNPNLILVEEIEAHLHPQRQLKIVKSLQKESKAGIQMILTTHSTVLASAVEVERLGIFHGGEFFSLAKGATALSSENYKFLGRFLDVTKANLFFAQGVILVEGTSEQLLVPEFANLLEKNLTDFGISVVSVSGLGFDHFANIYKRNERPFNKIPVAIVTDADKKSIDKLREYEDTFNDAGNRVKCFTGDQISSTIDISKDRGTTFEKLILARTTHLKQLYIESYNSLKKRKSAMLNETMGVNFLYSRIEKYKAPIAQMVAQKISEITEETSKENIKNEIQTHLSYISGAIDYVIDLNEPD